jgi:PIN domain nuclease of toxin-antitoxin system
VNILLDACSFLWIALEPERLSPLAATSFTEPANIIYLSSITCWEIGVKYRIGKLPLPVEPKVFIPETMRDHQTHKLDLTSQDTFHLQALPAFHKDPFDRMLICQAIENGLTILTPDEHIRRYPVKTLW